MGRWRPRVLSRKCPREPCASTLSRRPGKKPRRKSATNGAVKFGPLDHWVGFNLRMAQASGQAAKPDQFGKVRRNIARLKTVMGEQARANKGSK